MMMKKTLMMLTAALAALSMTAATTVPSDSSVRTGVLANGLTYYVKQNNYPEHRADFFIAQRVGSIQEEENQRGLAHFLEHMCFNGTKHFPGNSLITYMEGIGVKFGANLNAYTSTDETVYNISNVPTERQGVVDTCLLVLADWSHNLLLNGKDINDERGVIEGEYRHRSGANYRLLEKASADLYPDNLYGRRMPIGLMSVVKNFKHKELRNYYKKWYHPGNQCIIVVGDIDPDRVVEHIKSLFAGVKQPKKAAAVNAVEVPDNEKLIATVQTDKEQASTSVRLLFKHDDLDRSLMNTTEALRRDYLKSVVAAMMRTRMSDLASLPEAPFTSVTVGDRDYMISKTRQAFQLIATAKSGHADDAMQWMGREVKRATLHGFNDGEYRRARLNYESQLDKLYRERDKYPNTRYARDFVRAYIDGESTPSIADYHRIMHDIIDRVTLDEVNAFFNSLISPTDRNVVLVAFAPDKVGEPIPTTRSLTVAFHAGRSLNPEALPDTLSYDRLLPDDPTPGRIVSEQALPVFDATQWTLSNGVKVLVKHTSITPGEIVIAGAGPGGLSQNYDADDAPSFKSINNVMAASGYGLFTGNDLKKALAGKDVKMRTFVSKTEEGFQGSSSRTDLETAMQLLFLKLTSPQKDEAAFNTFIENNRARLANQGADPKFEFADSIFSNVFAGHPLGAERLSLEELPRVSYDKIMDCYRDRMSDVSDFNVYIVGDFDTDTLRTLVEHYIASLPGNGRMEQPRDIGYRLFKGDIKNYWRSAMENPQDKVYYFWTGACDVNLRNSLLAKVTGQIFTAIFRKEIREDRGWTYHVDTHCSVVDDQNGDDAPVIFMPLNVTVTAGKAAATRDIIDAAIKRIGQDGPTQEQLDSVKKYLRKVYAEDRDDNTYWMAMMKNWVKRGQDYDTDYLTTLDAITPADIAAFVRDHVDTGNRLILTMTPK